MFFKFYESFWDEQLSSVFACCKGKIGLREGSRLTHEVALPFFSSSSSFHFPFLDPANFTTSHGSMLLWSGIKES